MKIKSIDLYITEKNKIAGVITCEYENKLYDFGASQIGDNSLCMNYINNNSLIGRYVKTIGFNGGIARASKIIELHSDK